MIEDLTPDQLEKYYNRLCELRNKIALKGIEIVQLVQLRKYVVEKLIKIEIQIAEQLNYNEDYNYHDYKGREVEYWKEKFNFYVPEFALKIIDSVQVSDIENNFSTNSKKLKNNRIKSKGKTSTFESLFLDTDKSKKVIQTLIDDEVLSELGVLTKPINHILAITQSLFSLGIINESKKKNRNLLFAKKFQKEINDRTATSEGKGHEENVSYYTNIFNPLK